MCHVGKYFIHFVIYKFFSFFLRILYTEYLINSGTSMTGWLFIDYLNVDYRLYCSFYLTHMDSSMAQSGVSISFFMLTISTLDFVLFLITKRRIRIYKQYVIFQSWVRVTLETMISLDSKPLSSLNRWNFRLAPSTRCPFSTRSLV